MAKKRKAKKKPTMLSRRGRVVRRTPSVVLADDAVNIRAMGLVIRDLQAQNKVLLQCIAMMKWDLDKARVQTLGLIASGQIDESRMAEGLKIINNLVKAAR